MQGREGERVGVRMEREREREQEFYIPVSTVGVMYIHVSGSPVCNDASAHTMYVR